MEALKVSHLRRVTRLNQGLETSLDQGAGTATEDGLLPKQIRLGLLFERGLNHPTPGPTHTLRPSKGRLLRLFTRILVDGDQRWNAFTLGKLAADNVPRPLGCHHNHIHVLRWLDGFEVDRKPMAEQQRLALAQILGNVRLVNRGNLRVRNGHKNHVSTLYSLSGVHHLKPLILGNRAGLAPGIESDDDLHTRFLQVQCVGMPLRTEADHGAGFPFELSEVGVFVCVDFGWHGLFRSWCGVSVLFVKYSSGFRRDSGLRIPAQFSGGFLRAFSV